MRTKQYLKHLTTTQLFELRAAMHRADLHMQSLKSEVWSILYDNLAADIDAIIIKRMTKES